MPKLIKDGKVIANTWKLLTDDTDTISDKCIVPLSFWLEKRDSFLDMRNVLGVWLNGDEDPSLIAEDLPHLAVVAINFPAFMDGRGFSTGRLIKERYGFTGDLRAIGNIIRDQLCYLRRCGFDSFKLPSDIDPDKALQSLTDFTEYYQAGVDQPTPLFRRRQA